MKLTNKVLQKTFDRLNEQYFSNTLKRPLVIMFDCLAEDEEEGLCDSDGIRIDRSLKEHPDFMILVMMHEMIHWKLRDWEQDGEDHGPRFQQEKYRLWNLGAYEGLL